MADTFRLSGSYGTSPLFGNPSADPSLSAPIDESLQLIRKALDTMDLTTDGVQAVSFNGLTNVHVLVMKSVGGKVSVRVTSADGTTQSIPVDSFLSLVTLTVPITAIDVARVPGTPTTVKIFLGERA